MAYYSPSKAVAVAPRQVAIPALPVAKNMETVSLVIPKDARLQVAEQPPAVSGIGSMNGLGLTFKTPVGNIVIDTAAIGNEVVNGVWPNVEGKIQQIVPGIIDKAIVKVEAELPTIIGKVMPTVEKEVNKLMGKYEARYMGMVASYQKYATPVAFAALAVAILVSTASIITIKNAKKGR